MELNADGPAQVNGYHLWWVRRYSNAPVMRPSAVKILGQSSNKEN